MGTRMPKWHFGWAIVAICIFAQIGAMGLAFNTYSLFLPMWAHDLHAPVSQLQLPMFAMMLVGAGTAPVIGVWADKFPARPLVALGLGGMALAYAAISFVTAAWQIAAIFGLLVAPAMGLCAAIVANALISRWFEANRGLALGLNSFGQNVAGVLLPPLVAPALVGFGWRPIWLVGAGVVALVMLPVVLFWLREPVVAARSVGGAHARGHGAGLGAMDVLRRANFWLIMAAYLPLLATLGGVMQNLAPYAASHGLTTGDAGTLLSLMSASGMAGMLVSGLLVDRLGHKLPFAGFALVTALGVTLLAFGASPALIYTGSALVGLSAASATLLATALADEFGAAGCGRAFGIAMAMIPLAAPAAFLVARAQEQTGSYTPALLALAGLTVTGGLLILLSRPAGATMPVAVPAE